MGLYDIDFIRPVLTWWEALVDFQDNEDDEIVEALKKLPELSRGHYPTGFCPPPGPPLPDLHVACRCQRDSGLNQSVASVREAQTLLKCVMPDEIATLSSRAGVDFTVKPGSRAYGRSLENSWEGRPHELRLKPGASLTRPDPRNLAILWFTQNASLHARLRKVSHDKKADIARDVLGLIHVNDREILTLVALPAKIAEEREDRGRPIFIDAHLNSRFKCRKDDERARPTWGRATNLEKFAKSSKTGISGHLERICGRVPKAAVTAAAATDELILRIRFLGAAQVPRKDFVGEGDKEFADLLEQEIVEAARGATLRDQLLALRH